MAAAADRPSAIAHTMSEAPRCMSPATNTPSASVCQSVVGVQDAARLRVMPNWSSSGCCSVPSKPMASSTRSARRSRSEPGVTVAVRTPSMRSTTDVGDPDRGDVAGAVVDELLHGDAEDPVAALLVRRVVAQDRPARSATGAGRRLGPRAGSGYWSSWMTSAAPWRWATPRQSAPVSPPPMITTCLPAASIGVVSCRPATTRLAGHQVFHGQVYAGQLPARCRRGVPAGQGARGEQHGVEAFAQVVGGDVDADVDAGGEDDALGLHLGEPGVHDVLLDLEVGDAVAQQAADPVVALEDGHGVPGAGELLRGGQAGRAGADHGDLAAGRGGRRLRLDVAEVERVVGDLHLDLLDGHRVVGDAQHAGGLARRRAQPAGELREVVGGVQRLRGGLPGAGADQVVPVRDPVAQRAALVAERDAAVHAPGGLVADEVLAGRRVHLPPVADAHRHRPPLGQLPLVPQETVRIRHP